MFEEDSSMVFSLSASMQSFNATKTACGGPVYLIVSEVAQAAAVLMAVQMERAEHLTIALHSVLVGDRGSASCNPIWLDHMHHWLRGGCPMQGPQPAGNAI